MVLQEIQHPCLNDSTISKAAANASASSANNNHKRRIWKPHVIRRHCHVRFNESDNQYYNAAAVDAAAASSSSESPHNDLLRELWYTRQDFARFHAETQVLAATMQTSNDLDSWPYVWMRIYFGLRQAENIKQVQQVLDFTPHHLDKDMVGLQDHALVPIRADYRVRRQHLLQQFQRLQNTPTLSESQKCLMIQETSLLNSHASRLYAMMVAHAAVGQDLLMV